MRGSLATSKVPKANTSEGTGDVIAVTVASFSVYNSLTTSAGVLKIFSYILWVLKFKIYTLEDEQHVETGRHRT